MMGLIPTVIGTLNYNVEFPIFFVGNCLNTSTNKLDCGFGLMIGSEGLGHNISHLTMEPIIGGAGLFLYFFNLQYKILYTSNVEC